MLLSKKDRALEFLKKEITLFQCPLCQSQFTFKEASLRCHNNHQFDVAKKGTLFFLQQPVDTAYDDEMLRHRQKMIQRGMFTPLIDQLNNYLENSQVTQLLDVGSGEGSFLNLLETSALKVGFDISKEGIALATEQPKPAFWCVADLTNLPFADESFSHLLNIFSPSHYQEFSRVLKPGGQLIKVVPEENYLAELRELFFSLDEKKKAYSNQAVVTRFEKEMKLLDSQRLSYRFSVPVENKTDLLKMSPLAWQVSEEEIKQLKKSALADITVDLRILVGQAKL